MPNASATNWAPACAPTVRTTSLPDSAASVLITRPEPGASETAARVAALGYRPVVAPLLEISTLQATLPPSAHVQAILATSGNAIPALPMSHRHLPLFAVGEATAERARAAGFVHVSSADGDSRALASLVAQSCDRTAGPLLFACGRDQGQALAGDLRARGFAVVRRVVYAAASPGVLPDTARQAVERAIRDPDAAVRISALDALERHDPLPSLPAVLSALDDDNREALQELCGGGPVSPLSRTRTRCSRCCDE
jgi:uroporphyrinogen-III synthase